MLCYQYNGNADLVQEVCQAKKTALSDSLLRRETPYIQATVTEEELLHSLLSCTASQNVPFPKSRKINKRFWRISDLTFPYHCLRCPWVTATGQRDFCTSITNSKLRFRPVLTKIISTFFSHSWLISMSTVSVRPASLTEERDEESPHAHSISLQ